MKELANLSGLSKATISRALNNDPKVKEETKQLVKQLAKKYNYHPHSIARSLARRQTKIVGLLLPKLPRTVADPFFFEFVNGVSGTLFESGYSVLIPQSSRGDDTAAIHELLYQNRVDGIILTEPAENDQRIELLQKTDVPFVYLGSTTQQDVIWVDGDNINGAYMATEHLINFGHQKIGIIMGEPGLVSAKKRCKGYIKALKVHRLPINREWMFAADFTQQTAYDVINRYLSQVNILPFTGLFATNDLMAVGAIKALKEHGFHVPEDISVIGFDGIEMTQYVDPPLTTMQQPIYKLGKLVTKQLIDLMQGNELSKNHIQFPLKLVIRQSCCKPKN